MAIEFKHGGRTWRADTVDEAIALRKRLEGDENSAWLRDPDLEPVAEQIWTPDLVIDLLHHLGVQQKAFIRFLHEKQYVTSDAVRQALRLSSEVVLAGVLS